MIVYPSSNGGLKVRLRQTIIAESMREDEFCHSAPFTMITSLISEVIKALTSDRQIIGMKHLVLAEL